MSSFVYIYFLTQSPKHRTQTTHLTHRVRVRSRIVGLATLLPHCPICIAAMDQAAQALSNILGSALDEIREELNELKQSNTALVKRSEAFEAAHDQSTGVIMQLQKALNETLSHAQAARTAHDRNSTLNQQLWESFKEVRGQVEAQSMTNSHLTVSLAEARNEVAAVKLLLDAMGSGQR